MTSLLTAELPSEDEEDQDFNPDAEQAPQKTGRKRAEDSSHRISAPVQTVAKRAKVDAIWDLLNQKAPIKGSQHKQQTQAQPQHQQQPAARPSEALSSASAPPAEAGQGPATVTEPNLKEAGEHGQTARALAAARAAAAGILGQKDSATVTRQFAGKKVEIHVDNNDAAAQSAKAAKQKSSLDAVLSSLQATKKANVLDKSRGDWSAFRKSDIAADEELTAHTNSNKKYLDKVDFLKRTELNEYERETAARLQGDVRLQGRT